MDRKLLERLFYEGIMPREKCCPRKKDYHDTMKLCDNVEQEFIALLSKEQVRMFQDYKRICGKPYYNGKRRKLYAGDGFRHPDYGGSIHT